MNIGGRTEFLQSFRRKRPKDSGFESASCELEATVLFTREDLALHVSHKANTRTSSTVRSYLVVVLLQLGNAEEKLRREKVRRRREEKWLEREVKGIAVRRRSSVRNVCVDSIRDRFSSAIRETARVGSKVRGNRATSLFLTRLPSINVVRKVNQDIELMGRVKAVCLLQGFVYHLLLMLIIWIHDFGDVVSQKTQLNPQSHIPFKFVIANPPVGLFGPIEISPAVIPHNPNPVEPLSPMYPTFPNTYEPVLTGRCPVNFSEISSILDKTASDCSAPLARVVGNVICCPQMSSLMHIFQGSHSNDSDMLVMKKTTADDCFSDIISILTSRGANNAIPEICSAKSTNLTDNSCPVKDQATFEKLVNTSKLLDVCSTIDPLKECCRPICLPAIVEAAISLSLLQTSTLDGSKIPGITPSVDALSDCKGVVYAWLSRKLPVDASNSAFRMLSSCKVNKACPLDFKVPSAVIQACRDMASSNPLCCKSLNTYINDIQKQMLITNRQAINCATSFGSMLQRGGVMTNIYELCNVDLKDFSLQAYGQQGCLLRSLPADVIFDNYTGFSFTCDLSDNIAAPWPSSATLSSLSLCAPEMSLPALPVAQNGGSSGNLPSLLGKLLFIFVSLASNVQF